MHIFLDLDDTLLNTYGFMWEMRRIFLKAGVKEDDFVRCYQEAKQHPQRFSLDILFDICAKNILFDVAKTRRSVDRIFNNLDAFVFNDVHSFLNCFKRNDLNILTFGNVLWQREKIENMKLVNFFDQIFIVDNKLDFFVHYMYNLKEPIFFIDDKADNINAVKQNLPKIITLQIQRQENQIPTEKSLLADFHITDLQEALIIINK